MLLQPISLDVAEESTMNKPETGNEIRMDSTNLYREEVFTDNAVGMLRRLTPVTADGETDTSREVQFVGSTQVLTSAGPLPLTFEIEAGSLTEAAAAPYADVINATLFYYGVFYTLLIITGFGPVLFLAARRSDELALESLVQPEQGAGEGAATGPARPVPPKTGPAAARLRFSGGKVPLLGPSGGESRASPQMRRPVETEGN